MNNNLLENCIQLFKRGLYVVKTSFSLSKLYNNRKKSFQIKKGQNFR